MVEIEISECDQNKLAFTNTVKQILECKDSVDYEFRIPPLEIKRTIDNLNIINRMLKMVGGMELFIEMRF